MRDKRAEAEQMKPMRPGSTTLAHPWLERKLPTRLRAVAVRVYAPTIADIGSDHGFLPAYLVQTGRVQRVIVVEKTRAPFERARRALARVAADVRLGDGLEPLRPGEVDCLTMSGFGAFQMARILRRHPERVPARLVLQPNGNPEPLLEWAVEHGFRLQEQVQVEQGRSYSVLTFERSQEHLGAVHAGSTGERNG
jgi:tRNA (adenine22-N1)-methyltransferase